MDDLDLIMDLHIDGDRQGPGGEEETRLAIALAGLMGREGLRIADIGCGTGASTLTLAGALDASLIAVDFLPPFLERLRKRADAAGFRDRIETLATSMDALPFDDGGLDAIWSEGAIYNMGFETGVSAWRRFLKPGGVLAVSELTWITAERPEALTHHWCREYPEVNTASNKFAALERNGYMPLGYFPLQKHCWIENYYRPIEARFAGFLDRHGGSRAAKALVVEHTEEIALYERYADYVSYGFYIARRVG
ncbi:MAG: class I SAM-dependent methyltransferase [Paracoccaceae bacterium]|nr:class I SAM-dependent methyltransferase [Paracoccaceae bacterium]